MSHIEIRVVPVGPTCGGISGSWMFLHGRSRGHRSNKVWKALAHRRYRKGQKDQLRKSLADDEIDVDFYPGRQLTSWDLW